MESERVVRVPGSTRHRARGAKLLRPSHADEIVTVTFVLRASNREQQETFNAKLAKTAPRDRKHMTLDELRNAHGAAPEDAEAVGQFAHERGLTVVKMDPGERIIKIAGTVHDLSKAFLTHLGEYETPKGKFRDRTGSLYLPEELSSAVLGILGLNNQPLTRHRPTAQDASVPGQAPFPRAFAQSHYNLPDGLDGAGQTIGIICLQGGYSPDDLNAYFQKCGISMPVINAISADGTVNHKTGNIAIDAEVCMDIEIAGSVATKSQYDVFFASQTSSGLYDALSAALHSGVTVISLSYGWPEDDSVFFDQQTPQALSALFKDCASVGITVAVASGDDGSSGGPSNGNRVFCPASDPGVLACGGTQITDTAESAWSNGGGGVSSIFALPDYQNGLSLAFKAGTQALTGRGVPDVAACASPGYTITVDGYQITKGGTSAAAPLWAAIVALINQKLGHSIGYLNSTIYALQSDSPSFNDITTGDNGTYTAVAGWDACTGLGTPNASSLIAALSR